MFISVFFIVGVGFSLMWMGLLVLWFFIGVSLWGVLFRCLIMVCVKFCVFILSRVYCLLVILVVWILFFSVFSIVFIIKVVVFGWFMCFNIKYVVWINLVGFVIFLFVIFGVELCMVLNIVILLLMFVELFKFIEFVI